jgi:phosphoribosyl 1,2-cyclic phosphate phosphodiesterase
MPIYLMPDTEREMTRIFSYAFQRDSSNESSIPYVDVTQILNDPFTVAGIEFQPLELYHGSMRVNGYRIGSMAYCTDCNAIPEQTYNHLHGLDLLILDALRLTPHPTHFTIDQATEIAHRIGAKKTYFTHIAHDILHQTVDAQLPDNIHLAYDGLVLDL